MIRGWRSVYIIVEGLTTELDFAPSDQLKRNNSTLEYELVVVSMHNNYIQFLVEVALE